MTRGLYRVADRRGVPQEQVIGCNVRDVGNFIQCPFISWLDPIERNKDYYLVQLIQKDLTGISSSLMMAVRYVLGQKW